MLKAQAVPVEAPQKRVRKKQKGFVKYTDEDHYFAGPSKSPPLSEDQRRERNRAKRLRRAWGQTN